MQIACETQKRHSNFNKQSSIGVSDQSMQNIILINN